MNKIVKSQSTNTKFQKNLKSQFPMTKTEIPNFGHFDFSNIRNCFWQGLNEKPNTFSELEGSFFKIVYRF